MTVHSITIALPDPWVVIDVADLASERLTALPEDVRAVRDLLEQTATQLADRQVGLLALRIFRTQEGPAPTGMIALTLDQSDATDLEEVERRVRQELREVEVRMVGETEHVVGVSTDVEEHSFIRGDFRLVGEGLLLTVWSTITVMDGLETEHEVLDIIVGNLKLSGVDGDD